MNAKQAKAIALPHYLQQIGHEPQSVRGNDLWYRSPLRPEERTASFKVNALLNTWYDFGCGEGGTIIDLVQALHSTKEVTEALRIISGTVGASTRIPTLMERSAEATPITAARAPEIQSLSVIENRGLREYLSARAIPLDLARLYLSEMRYRVGEHQFLALAFPNDAGGYEVRNPHFKGAIGKKDLRFLAQPERRDAAVFEGVFDFLSMLVIHAQDRPTGNVLILNSVALAERGIACLQAENIERVSTYFDHDIAGKMATATFQRAYAEAGQGSVRDASAAFAGYKDVNAYLVGRHGQALQRDAREQ